MKDFAIATFGTNDKAALFVGMGLTILLLACVLGVVAYRKWALGVAGVLLMGAVIVASVVTRASVKPLDAIPTVLGTVAGLIVLRLLITRLWRMQDWPEAPADVAAKEPDRPATSRRASSPRPGITAAAAGIAATGGRLLERGPQQRGPGPRVPAAARAGQGRRRRSRRCAVQGARRHAVADAQQRLLPD